MALKNCPECNGQVSDTAASCPHCGFVPGPRVEPAAPKKPRPPYLIAAAVVFFLSLVTPRALFVVPVIATVALAVVSIVRKEGYQRLAAGVAVLAVLVFIASQVGA
jgi:hypothetical protein